MTWHKSLPHLHLRCIARQQWGLHQDSLQPLAKAHDPPKPELPKAPFGRPTLKRMLVPVSADLPMNQKCNVQFLQTPGWWIKCSMKLNQKIVFSLQQNHGLAGHDCSSTPYSHDSWFMTRTLKTSPKIIQHDDKNDDKHDDKHSQT